MNVLETDRLRMRQWEPDDAALLRPIVTDSRVLRYIGKGEPWSDERIRRFIDGGIEASRTHRWLLWPVVLKETNTFIGFAGFNGAFAPEVEIGWWLSPDYWGRGLATEVGSALLDYGFRTFGFPRVISLAQPANTASIRVMKKLGIRFDRQFVHDGVEVVSHVAVNPAAIHT
jgi:ribosomal-protein-alanine N-acetyltransferase